jgi:predicted amidohydrolase YtcJ
MKTISALSLSLFFCGSAAQAADVIFLGDNIVTMDASMRDREPTAVAIEGERIVWVGARDEHAAHVEDHTEVVELGERALLPGFIDAHGHFTFYAATVDLANVASPPVGPATDMASLQKTLLGHIDSRGIDDGKWVVGFGYDDSLLAENRHPTREDLDAVSTTHPIVLMHVSGHLATANSRALELSGVAAAEGDPPGGHIRRDADGRPNGVLEESATYPFRRFMFENEDAAGAFQRVQDVYAAYGVTTVQDGFTSPEGLAGLKQAAAAGALKVDVVAYPGADPANPQPRASLGLGGYEKRLKVAGVKLMLDGSPQGKTAYLTKPYHVPPHGKDHSYAGYPAQPQETVEAMVRHFLREGVPMIAHANGDAAGDMLIGSVKQALAEASPLPDHRTVMIHAQTMREDQVRDMAELGMIPSYFSAHTFYWGDWHRDSVLGPERGRNISPAAWSLAYGGKFTVHNDSPVVPADMIRLLWATTNRQTRSGKTLGHGQRIGTYAALRAMTIDAAYQSFDEDLKGSIRPGKLADLVVLDRNPLLTPRASLLDVQVQRTYSRGTLIYGE